MGEGCHLERVLVVKAHGISVTDEAYSLNTEPGSVFICLEGSVYVESSDYPKDVCPDHSFLQLSCPLIGLASQTDTLVVLWKDVVFYSPAGDIFHAGIQAWPRQAFLLSLFQ